MENAAEAIRDTTTLNLVKFAFQASPDSVKVMDISLLEETVPSPVMNDAPATALMRKVVLSEGEAIDNEAVPADQNPLTTSM